jgi:hypothetical protein
VVKRGSLFAAAMLAIIRSATRTRGLRPMLMTSAAMIPYYRAASASKGHRAEGGFHSLHAHDPAGALNGIDGRMDTC